MRKPKIEYPSPELATLAYETRAAIADIASICYRGLDKQITRYNLGRPRLKSDSYPGETGFLSSGHVLSTVYAEPGKGIFRPVHKVQLFCHYKQNGRLFGIQPTIDTKGHAYDLIRTRDVEEKMMEQPADERLQLLATGNLSSIALTALVSGALEEKRNIVTDRSALTELYTAWTDALPQDGQKGVSLSLVHKLHMSSENSHDRALQYPHYL